MHQKAQAETEGPQNSYVNIDLMEIDGNLE